MQIDEYKTFKINIDNYSGPLEVLLDLAKAQKVNLANISITQLADQFIEFIDRDLEAKRVDRKKNKNEDKNKETPVTQKTT